MDSKTLLVLLLPLLLRAMIAPYPHSGQGNHHGSMTAYGGDYEAQRHWMEITLHLPISQWYKYDLSYWGLDYPPLIAYGSYFMGWASQTLVGPETVAFFYSRGYEGNPVHKSYMRATVIFWDAVVLFPALYLICKRYYGGSKESCQDKFLYLWLGCMLCPPMILVDNGHFQYNNVSLGLALGAFHFMTITETIGMYDILGSVLFCLALNWKQMILYYAPAVFSFLLGKCFRSAVAAGWKHPILRDQQEQEEDKLFFLVQEPKKCLSFCYTYYWDTFQNILKLGLSVLTTFGIIWYPFYHYRQDPKESLLDVFGPILKRIFPFSRGLFEGKVANLWCVGNIKPISIRSRIPERYQPLCALVLTLVAIMPFCILLFDIGKRHTSTGRRTSSNSTHNLTALLWGAAGTSLSFFLASFQVHEKSILLPLAPLMLLLLQQRSMKNNSKSSFWVSHWFPMVCTWSLWHLMVLDRLQVVYFAVLALYMCYVWWWQGLSPLMQRHCNQISKEEEEEEENDDDDVVDRKQCGEFVILNKIVIPCSMAGMVGLHVAEAFVSPPKNLPDIFPVLWTVVACMAFVAMWIESLLSLRSKAKQLGQNGHYKLD